MPTVKIVPPNSLFFISDARCGSVPDPDEIARQAGITATASCVAVCCLAEIDGPTEITIGPADEVGRAEPPAFEGFLDTPTHTVVVSTVESTELLQVAAAGDRTQLKIWTNRKREPDNVVIGLA